MQYNQLLILVSTKLPDLMLAIGIFILFWIAGKIFKTMLRKVLDERSPHANISQVLAGIIKNIMVILGMKIQMNVI